MSLLITLCILGVFICFLSCVDIFQNQLFREYHESVKH